jgi:phosphate:Na+ symporter
MSAEIDFWRLAAGLGLFLYGMLQLERALQRLAGRSFKQFLRARTSRPLSGVLTGAVATAALQSSSVVGLIVLAFIGAGIISLASAIGIGFGSNLGTTATGWLVATLGFKLDIEAFALPVVTIGALGIVWSQRGSRRYRYSQLVLGFGLLLIGLGYMKTGTSDAASLFDPDALAAYPGIVFLGAGLLLTAVIQSSSATIMITLSALYAGAIPLQQAAAVAIGADLGTTITILLGAMAGSASKKRVAAALILFNVVTDTIAFVLLEPLLGFVAEVLRIDDPLYSLVAFHSLFNLIGIAIFLPAIGLLSRRLENWFTEFGDQRPRYLTSGDVLVPEVAIDNLQLETRRLVDQVAALNQRSFGLTPEYSFYASDQDRQGVELFERGASLTDAYLAVKRLEGAITEYALELESQPLQADESAQLHQLFTAVRDAVHSAKTIRDTLHDLDDFAGSVNDAYHEYLHRFRDTARQFYRHLEDLRDIDDASLRFEKLVEARRDNEELHRAVHESVYAGVSADTLAAEEISTVLNVNRELFNANLGILFAIADLMLDQRTADDFRALPATH